MKKVIGFFLFPICAVVVLSLIVTPQTKIQHRDSSAFQLALQQAVDRLEGGSKLLLAGTVTPVAAQPNPTFDGRYTCDTYEPSMPTCDVGAGCLAHTVDPLGHTCTDFEYTCQLATCDTYDAQMATCDGNDPACLFPHTAEPAPYNHTCEGHTCDGTFTCDFTVDPRAFTCDAADPQCLDFTFDAFQTTCDPMRPECRINNPKGYCTAQNYPTCVAGVVTCDVADPLCVTINPAEPECATPVEETTWGQIKQKYSEQK